MNKSKPITNTAISFCSVILLTITFTIGDAEVYLFPRIIAVAITLLSILLWFDNTGDGISRVSFKTLVPGLLSTVVYIFCLEFVGFYTGTFLIFLAILMIYSATDRWILRDILIKVSVSAGFTLALYLLFWQMLQVRTPNGLLF